MAWLQLLVAGVLEIGWAIGMKYSDGFTKRTASVLTITGMVASFYLLAQAVRVLPIGTAYGIWTGIGAAGTAILGMLCWARPFRHSEFFVSSSYLWAFSV